MIVDDEPENLDVLGTMLSEAGWAVRVFPQGELALAAAREEPPALVLLDVRMPGMDGYDLCRCFKEDARLCQIPILFASGCATKALGFPLPISSGFSRNSGCLSSQWEHPILPLVWAESTTITMRSNYAERYRSLRVSVSLLGDESKRKITLITSAMPGEGKSLTAANFAASAAEQGRKTLLIDLNLRKPTLHKQPIPASLLALSTMYVWSPNPPKPPSMPCAWRSTPGSGGSSLRSSSPEPGAERGR